MNFTTGTGPSIAATIPTSSVVTSLSYHEDGVHLFAATEADSKLYLINSVDGKCKLPAYKCERDGIAIVSKT
jgi:WD40 repeat protein